MSSYLKSASSKWPFVGLRPFQYDDHDYFFGRDEELKALESQVRNARFVAIVGGSGSGKSSLIKAGLRPRLVKAPDLDWKWVELHPAEQPIRQLALALAGLADGTGDLLEACADRFESILAKSSFGIGEALAQIPGLRKSQVGGVLLLVDQFEELFRFANFRFEGSLDVATAAERRDEATAFVRLLLTATNSLQLPIHVVVTMRSDFIGDCARFHGLPEAVSRSQFLVPGMTRDQREDVIRRPVHRARGQIDPEVVQRALIGTNEDPDQLPILQHAMMRCWERAYRRSQKETGHRPHLTHDDYTAVGGVERALSLHANDILAALTKQTDPTATDLQLATKRIFQALTETDEEGRSTRSPQRFGHLVQYVGAGDVSETDPPAENATRIVVREFAKPDCSFLRVIPPADRNQDSEIVNDIDTDSIIDIGHEALIRRWDKLKGVGDENWMRDEQEDAERYRDLLRYAAIGTTIPPEDLTMFEAWWSNRNPSRLWARRYTKHRVDRFGEVREVLARSRTKADAAIEESHKYETRVLGIVADAIRAPMKYRGAADSLALALNKPSNLPNVAEYVELLYRGLGELRERRRIKTPSREVFAISFSPSGKVLAAVVPGELLFYDAENGELVHRHEIKGSGWVLALRWSPNGKRIYVGTSPIASILAPCSIRNLRKYFQDWNDEELDPVFIGNEEYPAGFGAWCGDSKWIVVAGWQTRASLWDASQGARKRAIGSADLPGSNPLDHLCSDIAASADNKRIAFGAASGKIHVFNTDLRGKEDPRIELQKSLAPYNNLTPYSLAFDPQDHDRLLASYTPSPYMALWNVKKSTFFTLGEADSGFVWRAAFDPTGEFVAAGTIDAVVRMWPTGKDSPEPWSELRGHRAAVTSVDISPENQNVASGSNDGTLRLWAKDAPLSPRLLSTSASMPHTPWKFSVENRQVSVTGRDGKNYWGTLPEQFSELSAAAVSANGTGIAVVPRGCGRPALLVDLREDQIKVCVELKGVETEWTNVAFIENDTGIAATTKDGRIFTWPFYSDVHSLQKLAEEHLPLLRGDDGSDTRLVVESSILRRYNRPSDL